MATVAVLQPGRRDDPAHVLGYRTAAALLAPWPREAGPAGTPVAAGDRTWSGRVLGGRRGAGPRPAVRLRPAGRCVALVLGTGGHRVRRSDVRAAAGATPGWCWHVAGRLVGAPLGDTDRPDGTVVEHGSLPDVGPLLRHADVVAGPSGGALVAEVAAAARPFVALPQARPFDEQHELARLLDRLGCAAVARTWPPPPRWAPLLEDVLAGSAGTEDRWRRWSDGSGAQRAADLVERTYAATADGRDGRGGRGPTVPAAVAPVASGAVVGHGARPGPVALTAPGGAG